MGKAKRAHQTGFETVQGSKSLHGRPQGRGKAQGVQLPIPILKAILSALSERDDTAEICKVNGQREPDTELRDYENVPLTENIDAYMEHEILPHVPDAWVDHAKTKARLRDSLHSAFLRVSTAAAVGGDSGRD